MSQTMCQQACLQTVALPFPEKTWLRRSRWLQTDCSIWYENKGNYQEEMARTELS